MSESRRFVAFDQIMSGPGKAVGHYRPGQRKPRMSDHKRHNESTESKQGTSGVHGPVARIAVLAQIERKELFVIGNSSSLVFRRNRRVMQKVNAAGFPVDPELQLLVFPFGARFLCNHIKLAGMRASVDRY